MLYFRGVQNGKLPWYRHGDIIIYAVSTAIMFHAVGISTTSFSLRCSLELILLRLWLLHKLPGKFDEVGSRRSLISLRSVMTGGRVGHGPLIFSKSSDFPKLYCFVGKCSDVRCWKGEGFEFYWKIFELAPPPLHVPRRL